MIHAQPKLPFLLLPQETAEKVGGVLIARHAGSDAVGIGDIRAQRYLLLPRIHRHRLPYRLAVLHGRNIAMVVAALAEDGEELGELLFIVTSIPVGNQHEIGLARPYGFIPFLFYSLARIVLQSPIFARLARHAQGGHSHNRR